MALTPEQKAANKERHKLRNKAHRDRVKQYRAAEEAGERELAECQASKRFREICDQSERIVTERNEKIGEIHEQIMALKEQQAKVEREYGDKLDILHQRRKAVANDISAERQVLNRRLKEQFPDLDDYHYRFSAPAWEAHCKTLGLEIAAVSLEDCPIADLAEEG